MRAPAVGAAWSVVLEPPAHGSARVDLALLAELRRRGVQVTRSALQRAFAAAQVRHEGRALRASEPVRHGMMVEVELIAATPLAAVPERLPLLVVHEDDDLLVIDKPAGMPVHVGPGHTRGTLVNAVLAHLQLEADALPTLAGNDATRPGIVHRLDKDTSGLLVVAKHAAAQEHLAAQFRSHRIGRAYVGVVHEVPRWREVHLDTQHGRDPADRRRFSPDVGTRRAITDASVQQVLHHAAVVRFELHTGRTHQIRMHARKLGHPILGDALYGHAPALARVREAVAALGRQALHAAELALVHPDGTSRAWSSALPRDMATLVAALAPAAS